MADVVRSRAHSLQAGTFRALLITWGHGHFRALPWRLTRDPYQILMAEVMLHRTQALQVVPTFQHFVALYPDVPTLAHAAPAQLHAVLHALGLRWRVDLICEMATQLMTRFGGQVPCDKSDLLSLPGVSEYIASAVRCFAWNCPEPLVDTNTVRVTGRLFGLPTKDSSRRNRRFRDLIGGLVDPNEPRNYNYALLDLANQVCMRKQPPDCFGCPAQKQCVYGTDVHVNQCAGQRTPGSDG